MCRVDTDQSQMHIANCKWRMSGLHKCQNGLESVRPSTTLQCLAPTDVSYDRAIVRYAEKNALLANCNEMHLRCPD